MLLIFDLPINGERVSLIGPAATVESKSNPGTFHVVYNGECDCKSWQFRGRCRHLATVTEFRQATAATAPLAEQAARAERIQSANRDLWG